MADLSGKRIVFIVDEMFEDSEFRVPYDRVKRAGCEPTIVGQKAGTELHGKKGKETIRTERAIEDVSVDDFDAMVLPGGYSPDRLRTNDKVVQFVRDFVDSGKPSSAICHAPWLLAEAGVSENRTLTSWPSIKTDLINAGANWVDQKVVEDGNLITSRKPDDLEAFCQALLRQLEQGAPDRPEAPAKRGKGKGRVTNGKRGEARR